MADKKALRKAFLDNRKAMAAAFSEDDARQLADLFASHFVPDSVALYHPIRGEVPVASLASRLTCPLALPCVTDKKGPLTFRRWIPGDDLFEGAFGILEPAPEQPTLKPSHIILPIVAVDRSGVRLGYGGGFYDRTLAALPDAVTIALGYDGQLVDQLPHEDHDIRVDYVLTPSRLVDMSASL